MAKSSFFKDGGAGTNTAAAIQNQLDQAAASAAQAATSLNSIGTELADATAARVAAEAAQAAAETAKTASEAARDTAITNRNAADASASAASTSESNSQNSENNAAASQSAAATSASNASTSETNAATSASNAATSASNAATSESNASTSASNAATSATASQTAQTASETAKTAAETAKTAAETAETNAAASQSAAATSASNAATSETNAATSASNAATSATGASSSASSAASAQTAAEAARDSALAAFDSFDDRYLGAKSSDPTTDNDGDALVAGSLIYNTTDSVVKIYTGSAWVAAYVSGGSFASLSGATFTGDVTVPNLITAGNVDGRDVSADGTKLDGIAAGATAVSSLTDLNITDGTNGQVLTTNGSGSFSFADAAGADADTLDGLDSTSFLRSDASDTMTGDLSITGSVSVTSGASDGISISHDDFGEALKIVRNDVNNAPSVTFENTSGRIGILWAQASNTALRWRPGTGTTDYDVWHTGNDGSGSGLDADTVDGIQGSAFLRSDTSDTASGKITMSTGIARNAHQVGHLEGGHNNIGSTSTKSCPIYTIGSSYNPSESALGNMYGIGYTHTNASFIGFAGSSGWGMYVAADGDARVYLSGQQGSGHFTGNITAYASDERLKTNITTIDNALDKVCQLRGVEYDWVDNITSEYDFHPMSMHETGVLAQNVAEHIPDAVREAPFNGNYTQKCGTDHKFLTVEKEKIIPVLIEAIKELKAEVEELKAGCCHGSS